MSRPGPSPRPAGARRLFAWYGDDLTGSADVLEVLAGAGIPAVLFLAAPTPARLARFPGVRAYGLAGFSRTLPPAQMRRELPPALRALKRGGAAVVQYKICSTFDSSPRIGSIGQAIELARGIFPASFVPVVIGAPALGRYVAFGNLFARSGLDSEPARLDRHPTMTRHPVTPMDEADLRVHLGRQTRLPIGLFDLPRIEATDPEAELRRLEPAGILLFDTVTEGHLRTIGRLLSRAAGGRRTLFGVGSSGLTQALVWQWRAAGVIGAAPVPPASVPEGRSRRGPAAVLAVSGSRSPVTARQIAAAVRAGFHEVRLSAADLAGRRATRPEWRRAVAETRLHFRPGSGVILHVAEAPAAPAPGRGRRAFAAGLGRLLEAVLGESPRQTDRRWRVVVCGGDTSTHAARVLGIEALEYVAAMAPGSPLCRAHAPGRAADQLEVVFKGGQVGRDYFFLDVAAGGEKDASQRPNPIDA